MARLRAGILGCGRISERHARAMVPLRDRVELVGSVSRSFSKAADFAARHGGRAYRSFEQLLEAAQLDVLVVALPPGAHDGQVEAAARAGIHLLLEKPIALDNHRAEAMVAAAQAGKIVTQVAFMQRFGVAVERWKALQAAGLTGPIGLLTGCFYVNAPHGPWWTERRRSGGQTIEQLIHLVDLVRHLMGEPDSVFGRSANLFHRNLPDYDIDDLTTIVFGFDDGRTAVLTASDAIAGTMKMKEWRIIAEQRSGMFSDENTARLAAIADATEAVESIAADRDAFLPLKQDFLDAIAEKRPALVPIEEGARSLALALAARQAGDERRELRLR